MLTAPNKSALKRRLDRYLWSATSGEVRALQSILITNFRDFEKVAIVGGLVRDFAREGRSGFHSDVDLVIDAPREKISSLANRLGATRNRFGGFGYQDGPWKVDFWALETTWARAHVHIERIEDIVSATFFDCDAIVYDLWERRLNSAEGYLDRLRDGRLEINLLPNPSPMGNLVRAVRRLILWNACPGPQLKAFIEERLDEGALRFIQEKEKELFRYQVSASWSSALEAKACLFRSVDERSKSQLEIPLS